MKKTPTSRLKQVKSATGLEQPGRTRAIATLGRQFDDIYEQLDTQLTRMAHIQLQFDALRSKIRQL